MRFVGSLVKYGAARNRGGDKVRTLTLEVYGSFEGLDTLMEKPLSITIEEEKTLSGASKDD